MLHRLAPFLLLLALTLPGCPGPTIGDDDDDSAVADDDDDSAVADDDDAGPSEDRVVIVTTMGTFTVQLFLEEAPITSENFLAYVDEGFYDGTDELGATIFHRVIADFVAQGGGQTADGVGKDTHDPIVNEAIDSGLSNVRGTLAMARTNAPDTATSQFFVNLVDNTFLDPGGSTDAGYAVFAEVVDGMDVVDAIGVVATDGADQPLVDVIMESVTRE